MGNVSEDTARRDRPRVRLVGTLRSVRQTPIGGAPALTAELAGDPGPVDLVWLGRRRITGIEPGSLLVVEGRLAARRGRTTLFNPWYELRTPPAAG